MTVLVNGKEMIFDAPLALSDLLDRMGVPRKFIAVERNGELVEGDMETLVLADGDRLEIARFVGGG